MRDYLEYFGYFLLLLLIVFVVHICGDGFKNTAYEAGQVISAFKSGINDGVKTGYDQLNAIPNGVAKQK